MSYPDARGDIAIASAQRPVSPHGAAKPVANKLCPEFQQISAIDKN